MINPRKIAKKLGTVLLTLVGIALLLIVSVILCLQFYDRDLPDVSQLKPFAPSEAGSVTYDRLGTSASSHVIPRRQMPALLNAVAAAEGKVDTRNWLVAFIQNFASTPFGRGPRYSSRIARELALGTGWFREWRTSIQIDRRFTPEETQTIYLNRVPLARGLFGVEDASYYYLGKHANELDTEDAALIAGLIVAPYRLPPENHPDRALKRRNQVIDRMLAKAVISSTEAEHAKSAPLKLTLKMPCLMMAPETGAMRTPAIYLEHVGDEDKPIYPVVIATARPSDCEIQQAIIHRTSWSRAKVFVVNADEFEKASNILAVGSDSTSDSAECRYVAVATGASVKTGFRSWDRAIKLVSDLSASFKDRQPELQQELTYFLRRLGG